MQTNIINSIPATIYFYDSMSGTIEVFIECLT